MRSNTWTQPRRLTLRVVLACVYTLHAGPSFAQAPIPVHSFTLVGETDNPHFSCHALEFSADNQHLAARYTLSKTQDGISVWSTSGGKTLSWAFERTQGHVSLRPTIAFSPAEVVYASSGKVYTRNLSATQPIELKDLDLGKVKAIAPDAVAMLPGEKGVRVALLESGGIQAAVYQFAMGKPTSAERRIGVNTGGADRLSHVSLTGFGSRLCLACRCGEKLADCCLEVWDVETKDKKYSLRITDDDIDNCKIDAGCRLVCVGTMGGELSCYDMKTGKRQFGANEVHSIADADFHPAGTMLAYVTRGRSDNVVMVDIASGKTMRRFSADRLGARRIRFSPDGEWVATVGGEEVIRLWRVTDLMAK